MSRPADIETRTVPVALLKAGAGVLLLLWIALLVAFVLIDWADDGPLGQRVAYGLMLSSSFVLGISAVQVWAVAVGRRPEYGASSARYFLGGIALGVPALTVVYVDILEWTAGRIAAVGVLGAAIIALAILEFRDRRRYKGEIVAPIAAMTVRTARGDREVRIAQPEGLHDRWMTRWSIGGTPHGTVQRVSYGPDPMRSLTAALADAEAATVVL